MCLNWPTLTRKYTEKRILEDVVSGFIASQGMHVVFARLTTGNPVASISSIENSDL